MLKQFESSDAVNKETKRLVMALHQHCLDNNLPLVCNVISAFDGVNISAHNSTVIDAPNGLCTHRLIAANMILSHEIGDDLVAMLLQIARQQQ